MFRLAERDHGLSLKILSLDSGIPFGTLRSYAQGTSMPVSALAKLARIIPNELTSLMLEPADKVLADSEPEETDLDDLARAAVDVLQKYIAARHPDSPGGIRIVHNEVADIKMAAAGLNDRAGKVVAA
ncbi:hypothetical protein PX699_13465 [Sphingobium sp. H39-3-25]|uniref:hypothetical protein n=1 Tax=Sphingobium arseniciresistens TaxID=3030834 RepID=UPI0023B8BA69|nr:hypothetical protein [Sphingobium arseniciresistens]